MSPTRPVESPAGASSPAGAPSPTGHDVAVQRRYSEGARRAVAELCCPVDHDPRLLAVIPDEVVARDYGCGNPTRHLAPGETVLDLGSGAGKTCFLAAQVVGPTGSVVGIDLNADMLAVARAAAPVVAERLGYDNVSFHRGRIEDLALDAEALDERLRSRPVGSTAELAALDRELAEQRARRPLVADGSIDVVVSNCVLNLVSPEGKLRLFDEIFRVLAVGGRAVISDIVADEDVPAHLQADPELWSGCVSGALREDRFLAAFERAGFHGIEILERAATPWRVVEGIAFRSVTVRAFKGKQGPCLEQRQAVLYKGPWSRVEDDDGHVFPRGVPVAVCGKTHRLLTSAPYAGHVVGIEPREPVAEHEAGVFACQGTRVRTPAELKGASYTLTTDPAGACCEPGTCC